MESNNTTGLPKGILRSKESSDVSPPVSKPEHALEINPERDRPKSLPQRSRLKTQEQSVITAIEPQARHKDRVNIYVDDKFALGIFEDVAVTLMLKVGQAMSAERLVELADAENRRKAREDAYRLLSFRARTEKEIRDRLKRREYEEDVVEETIQYLHEQHLLNDADFATRLTASRTRTHGERAIAMELRQKGVAADTIKETLAENADSETEQETIRTLAVKRVGEDPSDQTPQAKARLWSFLARRGFGSDAIRTVLSRLYGQVDE